MRKKAVLNWTRRAIEDLVEIASFIARDKPRVAKAWTGRLRKRARDAASMPLAGRRVCYEERDDIREVIYHGYRIVYRVDAKAILVLRVLESHRQFPPDLDVDGD